ncbi:ABC transporter ATP-binding protein [Aliamphritea spongicola]|uniref:ABC transporter ATP-binding protein n=1 Tax=Aliamphritea spongicola TaxID=707589 RepID=UPI00196B1A3F|nr:ABC transporter ATP-binding protein [Aliamphritea spongicola]MBN3561812.1 ABC transporter ATP-binding protein [Aliamphritea spongicola]
MHSSGYNWRYIFSIAREYKPELIKANLIALVATIASVPLPLLMPLLVDEVLLGQPATLVEICQQLFPESWQGAVLYITAILVLTIILRCIALVLNVWQGRQFTHISKEVVFRIRQGLLQKLKRISMAKYETLGSGKVSNHFVVDLDTIDQFVGTSLSKLLLAGLTIAGTAVVLLWMHWQLALFILLLNPIVVYFTMVLGKRVKELKKDENAAYGAFQSSLIEVLEGIYQIRAANREKHYLKRLQGQAEEVRDRSVAFGWRSEAAGRFSFMVFLVGFDLFRALSMLMVVFSDLSIGEMMAVFGYLWFMMGPVQELLGIQYAYYSANAALSRINELQNLEEEPDYPHLENPFSKRESIGIAVDNIHFGYLPEQEVLKGLSLTIEPGQKIALVGASGGGKSTLVQILLGLYPIRSGSIRYDGVQVEEIGFDLIRENVVTVLQQPMLFNDTVRGNLTLGRRFDDDKLWQALDIAQLKTFVEGLDGELDALVGRQGVRLSGGQRQRLAIARMVLSDPKVVILDEATSALDAQTEFEVLSALETFLAGRTTIIVAHRLSAVKQADRVYVFEDGQISEQGEHQDLLQQDGLYAKLYGQHQH